MKAVGKPLLSDARQGIYTLPIIYSLNSPYRDQTIKAIEIIDKDGGKYLLDTVLESGSPREGKGLANKYIKKL